MEGRSVHRKKPRHRDQPAGLANQGEVNNNRLPWMPSGYFGESAITPNMERSLHEMKYAQPTSIQEAIIPLVRAGRDIVGQAQTGTGKTAAFGIPLVEALDPKSHKPQALVLTPTRELAVQVNGELNRLGKYSGIRSLAVYGGQSMETQVMALQKGVQIMVATPGRLMDHMRRGTVQLGALRTVVLDEADQMLDIGFADDIEHILRQTPQTRQTLLLSATMPTTIQRLVYRYLEKPKWVRIGGDAKPVEKVTQIYYEVAERDRPEALIRLLKRPRHITQALIFRRTKLGVDRLVMLLRRRGYDAQPIHGDMTQAQREIVILRFRSQRLRILVATNVAARGLDIPAVSHVINYDIPGNLEEYVHRIGRTARMGRDGTAITFVSEWDFSILDLIQAHIGDDLHREEFAEPFR